MRELVLFLQVPIMLVPNSLLLIMSVLLLRLAWRRCLDRPVLRTTLMAAASLEVAVSLTRFGGLSLATWPWFGEWVRVIDPFNEGAAILGAFLLCLTAPVLLFLPPRGKCQPPSAPCFHWQHLVVNLVVHAFILTCLAGKLVCLGIVRSPWAPSPDGRCEIRLIQFYDRDGGYVYGHVVYRHPGDLLWHHVEALVGESPDPDCTFEWSPDSKVGCWIHQNNTPEQKETRRKYRVISDVLVATLPLEEPGEAEYRVSQIRHHDL
jgi:hypothetical protein